MVMESEEHILLKVKITHLANAFLFVKESPIKMTLALGLLVF